MLVQRTTANVHSGTGAYQVSTLNPIAPGGFGFFQTQLAPAAAGVQPGRDLRLFDQASFWFKNNSGSNFNLKFELKDYRDSGSHVATRNIPISSASSWQQITVPLNLSSPGWNIVGNPDVSRSRFFGFVMEANQGQSISGTMLVDDFQFREAAGALDSQTASLTDLASRVAQRQFQGLWGSRNYVNGLIPIGSGSSGIGAMNTTAAMVKMLPAAVQRGWLTASAADAYVQQVVSTMNTAMNSSTYTPPRYMNMTNLSAAINEESVIDTAFMALALHQYKSLPTTTPALAAQIDTVQNRFNLAAFSDTQLPTLGWKLGFNTSTQSFTSGTYDGYSGENWLISLAAHLATQHHVDIQTHYHSGVFRQLDFLVNSGDAHLVHSSDQFRAPFLQWLMPLFVDVSERGIDTYPVRSLASNPVENAERYQRDVDAYFSQLNRGLFLQPDAGDDGSGSYYQQFSAYNNHGRGDLFMPWSSTFSLLGDTPAGEAALRFLLEKQLHGPLGLSDSARWTTIAANPYTFTAGHDFWNTSLATMALLNLLEQDQSFFTQLPEVAAALDKVFFLTWDGGNADWNSSNWNGGMLPPSGRHDSRILAGQVAVSGLATAHRTRVVGGHLTVDGTLQSPLEVQPLATLSGDGQILGALDLQGKLSLAAVGDMLSVTGDVDIDAAAMLVLGDTFTQPRGTMELATILSWTGDGAGEFGNIAGTGAAAHLGDGYFLASILHGDQDVQAGILAALPGDANGDRVVDGSDFSIWNANKFRTGTDWATGDFNDDGVTDGSDFGIWNTWKFTAYDSVVPEPMATASGLWCLLFMLSRCKKPPSVRHGLT